MTASVLLLRSSKELTIPSYDDLSTCLSPSQLNRWSSKSKSKAAVVCIERILISASVIISLLGLFILFLFNYSIGGREGFIKYPAGSGEEQGDDGA